MRPKPMWKVGRTERRAQRGPYAHAPHAPPGMATDGHEEQLNKARAFVDFYHQLKLHFPPVPHLNSPHPSPTESLWRGLFAFGFACGITPDGLAIVNAERASHYVNMNQAGSGGEAGPPAFIPHRASDHSLSPRPDDPSLLSRRIHALPPRPNWPMGAKDVPRSERGLPHGMAFSHSAPDFPSASYRHPRPPRGRSNRAHRRGSNRGNPRGDSCPSGPPRADPYRNEYPSNRASTSRNHHEEGHNVWNSELYDMSHRAARRMRESPDRDSYSRRATCGSSSSARDAFVRSAATQKQEYRGVSQYHSRSSARSQEWEEEYCDRVLQFNQHSRPSSTPNSPP